MEREVSKNVPRLKVIDVVSVVVSGGLIGAGVSTFSVGGEGLLPVAQIIIGGSIALEGIGDVIKRNHSNEITK